MVGTKRDLEGLEIPENARVHNIREDSRRYTEWDEILKISKFQEEPVIPENTWIPENVKVLNV